MRRILLASLGPVAAVASVAWSGHVIAGADATAPNPQAPAPSTTVVDPNATTTTVFPTAAGPLIVVPAGCVTPAPSFAVFTGSITAMNDEQNPTVARFRVDRSLSGDLGAYEIAGETDVEYGSEARFLTVGSEYIVGVRIDPGTGRLISRVREEVDLFGGDAVIGLNDTDTACPTLEDPVRTFLANGSPIDTGVLSPLHGEKRAILWAFAKPLLLAMVALIALVLLKLALFAVGRSLRDLAFPETPPQPPPASPSHPSRPQQRPARPRPSARRPAQPS